MKTKFFIILALILLPNKSLLASSDYFGEGLIFFNKNEFDKAKLLLR